MLVPAPFTRGHLMGRIAHFQTSFPQGQGKTTLVVTVSVEGEPCFAEVQLQLLLQ